MRKRSDRSSASRSSAGRSSAGRSSAGRDGAAEGGARKRPAGPDRTGAAGAVGPAGGLGVATGAATAAALLDPLRSEILELLREPASATAVAESLGLPRQRVNYHVRALERAGLVEEVGRRRRRGLEERLVRATARHWVVSPSALGGLAADASALQDRFSSAWQVAVAARTIEEVAHLRELAAASGKPLATLTLDAEVRFGTAAERASFAEELTEAVARLVAKYHRADAARGRTYRVFAGAHPEYRRQREEGT